MANVNELKAKFEKAQTLNQNLKEAKIRVESEINTLTTNYNEQVAKLMELTATSSLEEAKQVYTQKQAELEDAKTALETELDKFLSTFKESK